MMTAWLAWMTFMFLLLVLPLGYGWSYRGWGPPYPTYIQKRRAQRAAAGAGPTDFNHHSWKWRGDFVWMVLLIGIFWAAWAILWR